MPVRQENNSGGAGAFDYLDFDPDDPDYVKELRRPAVIKEDMNEMERRQRVRQVLHSEQFRSALEGVIKTEKDGEEHGSESLERLTTMCPPKSQIPSLHLITANYNGSFIEIADLHRRGLAEKYGRYENKQRNKLASLYRLVDLLDWGQGIYNHITLRLGDNDEFLINPFGLLYHEITASNLIKVNVKGEILDSGSLAGRMGINAAGYALHSAIHDSRHDAKCVIHIHTPAVAAVASMKQGLLPISKEAIQISPVSYHPFSGIVAEDERELIQQNFKENTKIIMLQNHGCVTVGETPEEALKLLFLLVVACETQIRAAQMGLDSIKIPDEETIRRVKERAQLEMDSQFPSQNGQRAALKAAQVQWEAWMRVLDNAALNSGHLYGAADTAETNGGIENGQTENGTHPPPPPPPPPPSSFKMDHIKKEKWVTEEGAGSQPNVSIKSNNPVHQFSPITIDSNSKEFKLKQRAIKERRRQGDISAGPQSQVFDGMTHQEFAHFPRDGEFESGSLNFHIPTASKGIIKRDLQKQAQVFSQMYAQNPFSSETDANIQEYMAEVKEKMNNKNGKASKSLDGGLDELHNQYSSIATENDISPDPETISLMQGMREHRNQQQQQQQSSLAPDFTSQDLSDNTKSAFSDISHDEDRSQTLPVDSKPTKKKKKNYLPSFLRSNKKGKKTKEEAGI